MIALKVLAGGACWLLIARIATPQRRFLPLLPFLAIGAIASHERLSERPEIFSFLFFVAQIGLLLRWRRRPAAWPLIALVGVQVLWANFHALAVLGVFTVGAFIAGETARVFLGKGAIAPADVPPRRLTGLLPLWLTALACAAALCATPYGAEGALRPLTLLGQLNNPQLAIAEFQSPFSAFRVTTAIQAFYIFCALLTAVLLLSLPRVDWSLFLLTAGLFVLAGAARRNISLFVLAALPLIGIQLTVLADRLRPLRSGGYIRGVIGLVISVALVFVAREAAGGRFYQRDGLDKMFSGGVDETANLHEAMGYVLDRKLEGTVFNDIDSGGYFIWRAYPERRAFIDSRLEAVPSSRLLEYREAVRTDAGWRALDAKASFDYVLLDHTAAANLPLISRLMADPAWSLAHLDPRGLVYLKGGPAVAPPPFRWRETPADPIARGVRKILAVEPVPDLRPALAYGAILLRLGFADEAAGPIAEALARAPDAADALLFHGVIAEQRGNPEEALRAYDRVLDGNPASFEALYNSGRLLLAKGEAVLAIERFDRALDERPGFARAFFLMGVAFLETDSLREAEASLTRALSRNPGLTDTRYYLAVAALRQGRGNIAAQRFQEFLARPDATPALRERAERALSGG